MKEHFAALRLTLELASLERADSEELIAPVREHHGTNKLITTRPLDVGVKYLQFDSFERASIWFPWQPGRTKQQLCTFHKTERLA